MTERPPEPPEIARLGVVDGPNARVNELVAGARLVDHHVHSILRGAPSPEEFTARLSESDRPEAARLAGMDSQLGVAVRRWCGPLLGVRPRADASEYLERRASLGNEDVAARLLPLAGFERMLVDIGFHGDELLPPDEFASLAGCPADRIVRLETLAERVALSGVSAAGFAAAFREALASEAASAVGLKSIVAYRFGLDFDPRRPTDREVEERAGVWLRECTGSGAARLADPVLLRFVIWEGASTGLPLQFHTGFGDPDLELRRADPLLLTGFIRLTEGVCPVMLLHTYPFHRNAGYLAHMFPHVYMDVGLGVNHVGAAATQLVAESLETAPFTKVLFSSDAWAIPELHLLGSWLWRRALARVLGRWVEAGDWGEADAGRAIALIGGENARRVYRLPGSPASERA